MIRAVAALLAVAFATCCGGAEGAGGGPGGWVRILAGGKTKCARGGAYAYWLRNGDPRRLLLFFQGSGGCFDQR